jgi:hypothetical protein
MGKYKSLYNKIVCDQTLLIRTKGGEGKAAPVLN